MCFFSYQREVLMHDHTYPCRYNPNQIPKAAMLPWKNVQLLNWYKECYFVVFSAYCNTYLSKDLQSPKSSIARNVTKICGAESMIFDINAWKFTNSYWSEMQWFCLADMEIQPFNVAKFQFKPTLPVMRYNSSNNIEIYMFHTSLSDFFFHFYYAFFSS